MQVNLQMVKNRNSYSLLSLATPDLLVIKQFFDKKR